MQQQRARPSCRQAEDNCADAVLRGTDTLQCCRDKGNCKAPGGSEEQGDAHADLSGVTLSSAPSEASSSLEGLKLLVRVLSTSHGINVFLYNW